MLGTIWNTLLFHPFLNILLVIYHLFGDNFGWAVIVLAILIRIALIPSTKSQIEMTQKMANLKPELDKLQKKYGNNQELLVKEQMALYKRVGYNPVGCLGSLLPQILILYAMIQVINVVTKNSINASSIYGFVRDWLQFTIVDGKVALPVNFTNFYFLDLATTFNGVVKTSGYTLAVVPYFILAILVGVVQYLSTKFMQLMQNPTPAKKKENAEPTPAEMQMEMMNSMNLLFPLMTAFISLSTPAVLGLYWFVQSLMLIAQYFILDKEKSITAFKKLFSIKLKKNK